MPKKRKFSKRKKQQRSSRASKNHPRFSSTPSLSTILLTAIARQTEPVSLSDLCEGYAGQRAHKKEIEAALTELLNRKEISAAGKKRYRLDDKGTIFRGTIEKHPRGFGFVVDLTPSVSASFLGKDPFLSIRAIGTANHGDRVLIRVVKVRKDGRPEAEIIAILERFSERLTGFYKQGDPPQVIPEDPRYPSAIFIVDSTAKTIAENDVVIVQVLPNAAIQGRVQGKIVEVLGSAHNIDVQMRMVIEKHNLPHEFPAEAQREALNLSLDNYDNDTRMDLRDIAHVTIDGETAKDFDDAIAVEKIASGYRLYVSIADVSHFVKPGSKLDKEAYIRGTSIYFPGRVIPMLPENLSNNLCSLVPGEDRLTFSAILDFNQTGVLKRKKFTKSIIRSRHRFTYTTVKRILVDRDTDIRERHNEFLTLLQWAEDLARILYSKRMDRGSIGFNIPEPLISLEETGRIKSIARKERNFAHQIIEEFMLAANEAVAELFTTKHQEFIYRIHEKPASEKVEEFASFAATLGLELPSIVAEPHWFAEVLNIVRGRPTEYVINNLLLRTMQQARYDTENVGHFGLAAVDYTHFTSPIRRYPDLLVHRFLEALLQKKGKDQGIKHIPLKEQAKHLSDRERAAISAEREMNDRLKIFFMEQFIGENFEAVISGVGESVLFVELTAMFISGSIDISTLTDDYYLYDIKRYRLIGEITGKTYQLGDLLQVTLLDVDHRQKRINFAPANTHPVRE